MLSFLAACNVNAECFYVTDSNLVIIPVIRCIRNDSMSALSQSNVRHFIREHLESDGIKFALDQVYAIAHLQVATWTRAQFLDVNTVADH